MSNLLYLDKVWRTMNFIYIYIYIYILYIHIYIYVRKVSPDTTLIMLERAVYPATMFVAIAV